MTSRDSARPEHPETGAHSAGLTRKPWVQPAVTGLPKLENLTLQTGGNIGGELPKGLNADIILGGQNSSVQLSGFAVSTTRIPTSGQLASRSRTSRCNPWALRMA